MKKINCELNCKQIHIKYLIFTCLLIIMSFNVIAQSKTKQGSDDNNAIIVVTGMRLNEDPKNFMKDLSVAEGALVKLTMQNGQTQEKVTQIFSRQQNKSRDIFYTADFKVALDSIYTIKMTYKDGTAILIENYCLLSKWKTHFYYHKTNGMTSPASIFRTVKDEKTKLNCCVYGVYPFAYYKELGGSQLDNK